MARIIDITTPLDPDVLLFHTMRGTEEMSRLFTYELELFSLDGEVDLDGILGKGITVTLERADGELRYFNGLCSRVSQGGKQGRFFTYHATVRPWLWFLTRTKNYRIFQEKTVPDILKEMFDEHSSIANVEFELTEAYTPWTYCVQYNESDFAFVSRLMEHEGISYFFKHTDGKHTLVIADSYTAHTACYEDEVPFIPPHERIRPEQEHVSEWAVTREVQPVKYALASYDFEKPSVDLQVRSTISRQHALAEYEVFEYGGDYIERGDGELYARMRIEEEQAKFERTRAVTNARAMAPGFLFKLGMHPRADQNAEYVVVSAEYDMRSGEHEGSDTPAAEYSCRFSALNTSQPFRAERITPKPIVQGPQTALVVGPGEIHTDNYGRVKVHFYWDRKSQRDDKSSCWIRVSQNWGGKGWGGMFIPHVGQEVIVMFEGGDPDLPLITGRVYNAENMPPVALPGGKTQSVIRDHGGNEIIMEGAAGGQKMRLHSPTHNTTLTLGNSGSVETDSNWMVDAKENYLKKIGGDFKSTVLGNIWDVYFGFFVRAIFGFVNTFIGGWKTEIIRGAEIKNIHGVKSELIKGHVFKGHSGREFTLNKSTDIEKAPSLLWQIKQAKHMHDGYVMRCRSNKNEKIAGDAMQKARAIRNTSDEFYTTARGKVVSKTPELLAKVNKYTAKASKYHVKAAKALMKAKTDIKDGTLTIK